MALQVSQLGSNAITTSSAIMSTSSRDTSSSTTSSPTPTQSSSFPTAAYIAIGGLAVFAVLCIAIFVFIAILCIIKQRR